MSCFLPPVKEKKNKLLKKPHKNRLQALDRNLKLKRIMLVWVIFSSFRAKAFVTCFVGQQQLKHLQYLLIELNSFCMLLWAGNQMNWQGNGHNWILFFFLFLLSTQQGSAMVRHWSITHIGFRSIVPATVFVLRATVLATLHLETTFPALNSSHLCALKHIKMLLYHSVKFIYKYESTSGHRSGLGLN